MTRAEIRRRARAVKKRLRAIRSRLRKNRTYIKWRARRTESLRRRYHAARRAGRRRYAARLLRAARKSAKLLYEAQGIQRVVNKREGRYERKLRFLREELDQWYDQQDGVVEWRGVPVAAWIVKWLDKSVEAGWRGTVLSGYRTPEYSESLCYAICGAPSCPGRCAGRASGHSRKNFPGGCVDVTDHDDFARIQRQIGSPLKNEIGPSDPNHFSVSGR